MPCSSLPLRCGRHGPRRVRCSVPALLAVFVPGSGGETNVEFHSSTGWSARNAWAVGLCPPCPPQGQGGARSTYGQVLRVWWGCRCSGGPGAWRTGSLRISVPQCTGLGLGLPCSGAVQKSWVGAGGLRKGPGLGGGVLPCPNAFCLCPVQQIRAEQSGLHPGECLCGMWH